MVALEDIALLSAFAGGASLRAVALQLGVSKSTLSRRIEALERAWGADLFLRRGRQLIATHLGETLIARAERARVALVDVEEALDHAARGGGRLVVAASPGFSEMILPRALATLSSKHPAARVEIRLGHRYAEIFDEQIDVALRRGPLADSSSLTARRLGALTMLCVASPRRSALLETTTAGPAAWPWIRVGERLEPFDLALGGTSRPRSVRVVPHFAVDSQRAAVAMAIEGLGVARVNAFLVREALRSGELCEVLPEARRTESAFAVYSQRSRPSKLLLDFVAALVAGSKTSDIWD